MATTITVTVVNGQYSFNGRPTPVISLLEGATYIFNQADSSNAPHPLRFSLTPDGDHAGGIEFTQGVTINGIQGQPGATVTLKVPNSLHGDLLYYFCDIHSGFGGTGGLVIASNSADSLAGTVVNDLLEGFAGNDVLKGFEGNDTLNGGNGNDTLNGGAGNDTLVGGLGNDTYRYLVNTNLGSDRINEITTGGLDTLDFTGATAQLRVNLGVTTTQTVVPGKLSLTLSANNVIENITGGNGSDRLIGNSLNNNIVGGVGDDLLIGGAGNDSLNGGAGNDLLIGGAGNDSLNGSVGNDQLLGGVGNDSFLFSTGKAFTTTDLGIDTLTDFATGDKIVLSKGTFTALSSVVGNGFSVAREFTSVADDSLVAGVLAKIVYSQSSGSLYYNQNGAGSGFGTGGEFAFIGSLANLTASDFVIS